MLQRVGLGQVRFNIPGLTADNRGVVTGRQLVLRFAALERLVSFLRLWSGEQALDDLQPGLRLVQVRGAGGAREVLVIVAVSSLPLVDAAARAARLAGGQGFTGAGKHFVQYRDARAPLGYDVAALQEVDVATDFILYGEDHTQTFGVMGELSLEQLLLRLDLQRQHGQAPVRRELLFLTVRRGLGPMVIAYLHRAERQNPDLRVAAALCDPPGEGSFQRGSAFWILRLENLPARLLGVFSRTPGLRLLAPVADNVAVALGYRHPVHLNSCKQVFPLDRLFLFNPPAASGGVIIVNPAPVFSPVADLVRLPPTATATATSAAARASSASNPAGPPPGAATARPVDKVQLVVPLRLEAAPSRGRVVATMVPWSRVGWIRSLCYALPASALRDYRLAFLERGVLVLAPEVLDTFPFGLLLHAPAPGLLVPLGLELRPAISPQELAARVGATGGAQVIFPSPREAPFRVPAEAIVALEARVLADPRLAHLPIETAVAVDLDSDSDAASAPPEIEIENQPLGPMPLWRVGR